MTPIPEWATRAAEEIPWGPTPEIAEILARVLGPEREALEAEVERLTRERDAAERQADWNAEEARMLGRRMDEMLEALWEIASLSDGMPLNALIARRALGEEE